MQSYHKIISYTLLPLFSSVSGFIIQGFTRKTENISGIYNRRNLVQKNYNAGSEGADSQIADGEVI